jgi:hypothetical protein
MDFNILDNDLKDLKKLVYIRKFIPLAIMDKSINSLRVYNCEEIYILV